MIVLKPGMLTSLQDAGRISGLALGVPRSGVMDSTAQQLSNWLVGKPADAPVLEVTMTGPRLQAEEIMQLGIAGADVEVLVNDRAVEPHTTLTLSPGDQLSFGRLRKGCRWYIAGNGSFQVEPWLNSCSTYLPAALGGCNGLALQQNDRLPIEYGELIAPRRLPNTVTAGPMATQTVRVILTPAFSALPKPVQEHILSKPYPIDRNSNRMGYRLQGEHDFVPPTELTRVVVPGTVQCPNAKELIITLADGQATGGYSQIAHVISADLPLLGQLKPSDQIRFFPVTLNEALKILRDKQHFIEAELRG